MGVMVLDADGRQAGALQRVLGGQVLRMEIVRHGARLHAKELLQVAEGLLEEFEGFVVLQVADVLAQDGVPPLGETKGIL